jgi:DNA uptake protein ComE-like DNA-binding protein
LIDTERNTAPVGNTPEEIEKASGQKATKVNSLLDELKTHTSILFGPTIPNSFTGKVNGGLNGAGFGVSMSVKPLTNKSRPAGAPPTSANNGKYAEINERRESAGGASYYVKGHLLNQELGGPGAWANLTPLSRSGNAQHERQAEAVVKRTVDLPAIVEMNVTPDYAARGDKSALLTRIANSKESADAKRVKSAIVEGEDWAPPSLSVQAYLLDESLNRKNTIMNQKIPNPVDRRYESYHLASSPKPIPVNLSTADAAAIATLPGIGPVLAERIIAVRDEREDRGIYRFSSYEQIADLVSGIGPGKLKALEEAGHVQLY